MRNWHSLHRPAVGFGLAPFLFLNFVVFIPLRQAVFTRWSRAAFACLSIAVFAPSIAHTADWKKAPDDTLKVELGIVIPSYQFEIRAPSHVSSKEAHYLPHVASKTGLALSYRNLGISGATTNPTEESDDRNLGNTKSTDVQLRFYGKRTYEFTYQSYNGYYLDNSGELDPAYIGQSEKIKRGDIETQNIAFKLYWNLRPDDYSMGVAFDQDGHQSSSSWAPLLLFTYSDSQIDGDSALIPAAAATQFGDFQYLEGLKRQLYAVGGGLGGIATMGGFFASALLGLGLGYQHVDADLGTLGDKSYNITGAYLSARASLGYNGDRHVFGARLIAETVNSTLGKGEVNGQEFEGKVFYAYRFDGVNLKPLNPISGWLD